jgi:hypothetical protein
MRQTHRHIHDTFTVAKTTADVIRIELTHVLEMLGCSFMGDQWQSAGVSVGRAVRGTDVSLVMHRPGATL